MSYDVSEYTPLIRQFYPCLPSEQTKVHDVRESKTSVNSKSNQYLDILVSNSEKRVKKKSLTSSVLSNFLR